MDRGKKDERGHSADEGEEFRTGGTRPRLFLFATGKTRARQVVVRLFHREACVTSENFFMRVQNTILQRQFPIHAPIKNRDVRGTRIKRKG